MEAALAVKTWVLVVVVVALCGGVPTTAPSQEELAKAQAYLSRFFSDVGVSAPNTVWRSSLDSFDEALKKMQEFFGLEVTQKLDTKTLEVMSRPRCGFTDVTGYSHFEGRPMWDKKMITYRVTEYTADLSQSEVDATLAEALKVYSDVVPLDFKQIDRGTADIMIKFKARDHGDFAPFDGPQGVLAHAYSPGEGIGGNTHFDEDETWTLTSQGTNLLLVAAHEFGHALGLSHSKLQTALMYPTYSYVNTDGFKLPDDDREGVQALYGVRPASDQSAEQPDAEPEPTKRPAPKPEPAPEPTSEPEPTKRPTPKPEPAPEPTSEPTPDRCARDLVFDAVTTIQGNLYFFKDEYCWRRGSSWDGISKKRIQSVWAGVSTVDAAYEYKRDNTVTFFQGNRFWRFRGNAALPGYPKPLSELGFPSTVTKVDAAIHVSLTSRTLYFVGNRFYSYNERRDRMDRGYPKLIFRELPGIGFRVDAAFANKGYLYFSYGPKQTEYHYTRRRALRQLFNYRWMDC